MSECVCFQAEEDRERIEEQERLEIYRRQIENEKEKLHRVQVHKAKQYEQTLLENAKVRCCVSITSKRYVNGERRKNKSGRSWRVVRCCVSVPSKRYVNGERRNGMSRRSWRMRR